MSPPPLSVPTNQPAVIEFIACVGPSHLPNFLWQNTDSNHKGDSLSQQSDLPEVKLNISVKLKDNNHLIALHSSLGVFEKHKE